MDWSNHNSTQSSSDRISLKAKVHFEDLPKDSKDYLEYLLVGEVLEMHFLVLEKNALSKYQSEDNPDDLDYSKLEDDALDEDVYNYILNIYELELGTKDHFISLKDYGEPKPDTLSFADWIRYVNGLQKDDERLIYIHSVYSQHHALDGTMGLNQVIRDDITKESIEFYNTSFKINGLPLKLKNEVGEFYKSFNEIFDRLIPIKELSQIKISDFY